MATLTLSEQLTEARAAYHDLLTGKSVVEFTDSNGEKMRYGQANRSALLQYITDLQSQLTPTVSARAPMRVFM